MKDSAAENTQNSAKFDDLLITFEESEEEIAQHVHKMQFNSKYALAVVSVFVFFIWFLGLCVVATHLASLELPSFLRKPTSSESSKKQFFWITRIISERNAKKSFLIN